MNYLKTSYLEFINYKSSSNSSINYLENDTYYFLYLNNGTFSIQTEILKADPVVTGSDQEDFEVNHKSTSNHTEVEIDSEGRQVQRVAAAKKGWTYLAHFFEFETSKDSSLECTDWQGNTDTSLSIKFYKSDNSEIIDAGGYASKQEHLDSECVRTEVVFKPSFDYELVSGSIRLDIESTEDCRLWVVGGVLELGAAATKEFARNMNLKYLGANEIIETDGRASKYMKKDIVGLPYQANQLKFIIKHSTGYKFKIMPTLEYFRE